MNLDDFAWNKYEQKQKKEIKFTYSQPKIKIIDHTALRNEIEAKLEKLPQKQLAQWALDIAFSYTTYFDNHLKNDPRIYVGIEGLNARIKKQISAYDLRKIGFLVNELSKESKTAISKYAARTFAQAIATGHMRGHAMVSSDYAIKTVNLLTEGSIEASTKERERQLILLNDRLDSYFTRQK